MTTREEQLLTIEWSWEDVRSHASDILGQNWSEGLCRTTLTLLAKEIHESCIEAGNWIINDAMLKIKHQHDTYQTEKEVTQ